MKYLARLPLSIIACFIVNCLPAQEWVQQQLLLPPQPVRYGNMGWDVAISGDFAMVTEDDLHGNLALPHGAVYVFNRRKTGEWTRVQKIKLHEERGSYYFAADIAMAGEYAIIGSSGWHLTDTIPGWAYIYKLLGGEWVGMQILTAPDSHNEHNDDFGEHVAISENVAIVGAPLQDGDESGGNVKPDAGAAYIYKLRTNGVWEFDQKIVANDRTAKDNFGHSVAISGRYALIGALGEGDSEDFFDPTKDAGAAYIFEEGNDGRWHQVQKLVSTDRQQFAKFGDEVALSGNTALVGAPLEDVFTPDGEMLTNAGAAYLYTRKANGEWTLAQKLTGSDTLPQAEFGHSVSVFGSMAVVGAPFENEGACFLYEKDARGKWQQVQKILALDGGNNDFFGKDVALSKRRLIIGANGFESDSVDQNIGHGAAYVFEPCIVEDSIRSIVCGEFISPTGNRFYQSGNYSDTTFGQKCDTAYHLDLTIHTPKPDFTADTTLCPDAKLVLDAEYPGAEYLWHDGSTKPQFTVEEAGTYWVEVSIDHCTESDTIEVAYMRENLELPNVITPNGDGRNDRFYVAEMDFATYRLDIYNRYGRQVFRSPDYHGEWDASKVADGVYYYILKYEGSSCSNEQTSFVHVFSK